MRKLIIILFFMLLSVVSNAQPLKIMTYNIRLNVAVDGDNAWPFRREFLTSQIQFYEPDIFGIQEAKPNQVIAIANALSQYSFIGSGRDGEGKGESSNIYYKKDRFVIKETNTFWLSETTNKISKGWDAAFNRVCTYALLNDTAANKYIWVFNTHLDHIGEAARTKGIELILAKIAELNTQNYPVIFMGDFNSEPNTERIIALKNQMDDSSTISEEKKTLIDYIFISKNNTLKNQKYAVLSDSKALKYPADHLPVFVKLSYN